MLTPVLKKEMFSIGSCYYNFLFKTNSTIVELGEARLRQLYGGPVPGDYIAWHWRHYDVDLPHEQPVEINAMVMMFKCVETVAQSVGVNLTDKPALVISDFNIFRQMVAKGVFREATTLNITAKHIDKGHHSLETYNNIFVDLYVMARARCLMFSRSGFSKVALWMGGNDMIKCSRDRIMCTPP
ncbi:hypothetical protein PLESTB_000645000 [Pleodorina starrii]|uniref:Uncharacterized protein n=1 Tax=Pleodorina starrii TaxID=330485 RepID=A0A9W6F1V9_9CHLO|nr:hypothetical protein PLESTM_001306300 [Pleodorina starrii]GLC52576.1 hypothetical protein PLESTB_000645000 [Pleodorina starrii]GLC71577.1 hypothetical protein PLESTF_001137300 [Pleodorina starrii]